MPEYMMPNPKLQAPSHFEIDDQLVAEISPRRWWKRSDIRSIRYPVDRVVGSRELTHIRPQALVVEARSQYPLYDRYHLAGVIRAMREGRPLAPLMVTAGPRGLYRLDEGLERFLASVVLGIKSLPVAYQIVGLPRYYCA